MRSARENIPISTRAASTVMPIRIAPAAIRAGLICPADLMDATSNAGAAGWARAAVAARNRHAAGLTRGFVGMMNLVYRVLGSVDALGNEAKWEACTPRG